MKFSVKSSFSKNRPVLHWTCYLEDTSRNFEENRKFEYFQTKFWKQYYLNELFDTNLWNIGGFDYDLALSKILFLFSCFTLMGGPQWK